MVTLSPEAARLDERTSQRSREEMLEMMKSMGADRIHEELLVCTILSAFNHARNNPEDYSPEQLLDLLDAGFKTFRGTVIRQFIKVYGEAAVTFMEGEGADASRMAAFFVTALSESDRACNDELKTHAPIYHNLMKHARGLCSPEELTETKNVLLNKLASSRR